MLAKGEGEAGKWGTHVFWRGSLSGFHGVTLFVHLDVAVLTLHHGVCNEDHNTRLKKEKEKQATGNRQQATGSRQQAAGNQAALLSWVCGVVQEARL